MTIGAGLSRGGIEVISDIVRREIVSNMNLIERINRL